MKCFRMVKRIIGILFITFLIVFSLSIFLSQKMLSKTHYTYQNEKIETPFKIVQLTDLHNYQFGKSNRRLVQAVAKEEPDAIFMTGDMLNEDEERTDILETLISQLKEIAPVYFSLGNHEVVYEEQYKERNLREVLEAAGATVLDKEYLDTEIGGQAVRIGGIYGYVLASEWQDGSEQRFMEEFENTDRFKILLSHVPEGLLLWKSMERWNVDLVFSGHVHGGQVRLPFVGGLFDPEEGFFPTYTKGMYACGHGTIILSAGLGSSRKIPRVNNLPEIVVCEMI